MNFNRFVSFFAIPLTVAIVAASTVNLLATSANSQTEAGSVVSQSQSTDLAAGVFVAGEQPTAGAARIVEENGHRYLELDSAFSTSSQGPDLHVLLDQPATPPQSYTDADAGRYINLGGLKSFSGTQRYPIPDGVQLGNYQSVVIWCRMANATFGYAPLQPMGAASLPQ